MGTFVHSGKAPRGNGGGLPLSRGASGELEGAIGCISAIWWIPDYPIWSLTYVGIGALVIFALAVYGGEAEAGS